MDIKSLSSAIMEITEEKGIPREEVVKVIEAAIASAYKKEYGRKKEKFEAKLDLKTGKMEFWQVIKVVDKSMILSEEEEKAFDKKNKKTGGGKGAKSAEGKAGEEGKIRFNPDRFILLEEARKIDKTIKPGEDLKMPVKAETSFGRIAAQTAKQVIIQKIKEIEKDIILKEYKDKEGEVVSGIVQRVEGGSVFLDIGKTSAILPKSEQVPGEFYRPGQRLRVYVLKTEVSPKGLVVIVSRAYPKLVSKLFELEVPEISSGQVEIKAIAREPGSKTKIAVSALEEGIDPIGSLVGQRGTRVLEVINELGGEKIDIIEWSEDPETYIKNALGPAKINEVKILPKNTAQAIVDSDQFSLAIGKNGQNVRLAAKLTGWKIDVLSMDDGLLAQKDSEEDESDSDSQKEEAENNEKKENAEPEKKASGKK